MVRYPQSEIFLNSSLLFASSARGSQCWSSWLKLNDVFCPHAKFVVGAGRGMRFWKDWWYGSMALGEEFLALFSFCLVPDISVAELAEPGWDLDFHRPLSPVELED